MTANHIGEVKSSTSKAKNPGHRITKNAIRKLLRDQEFMADEFGHELRPVYVVSISHAGTVLYATSEEWYFRYLVAYEELVKRAEMNGESEEQLRERLDDVIQQRIEANCSERYK